MAIGEPPGTLAPPTSGFEGFDNPPPPEVDSTPDPSRKRLVVTAVVVGIVAVAAVLAWRFANRTETGTSALGPTRSGSVKAVGATTGDILLQFLVDAVAISLVGGILGIGVGVITSMIISRFAQWSTVLSTGSIVMAFAFSALVGVFFGYYPARKAAFLDPIEALRYE